MVAILAAGQHVGVGATLNGLSLIGWSVVLSTHRTEFKVGRNLFLTSDAPSGVASVSHKVGL